MAYPQHIPMDCVVYNAEHANISGSASTVAVPVVAEGVLTDIWASIANAITVANAVITVKLNPAGVVANAITLGTITIVQSGSGIGSTFQVAWSASISQLSVNQGDSLSFSTDGGSTTACVAHYSAVVNNN